MQRAWGIACTLALLACAGAGGPSRREIEEDLAAERYEEALGKLAVLEQRDPENPDILVTLSGAHYRIARSALDRGDKAVYVEELGLAQESLVKALEIDPAHVGAHVMMGIVLAYKGQMKGALNSFMNARRLEPSSWLHYANLAETQIYMGNIAAARGTLDQARKRHAPAAIVEMNEVLAAWRTGDYTEARDLFDGVLGLNPDYVKTWNAAPVSDPIESFEDFTAFCCGHVACGPYMANACKEVDQQVVQRGLAAELKRRELELEMQRRRRLRDIYKEHRELDIRVEPPEEIEK